MDDADPPGDAPLRTHEGALVTGTVVDRPNRFVLRVRLGGDVERVYLGDPGALTTVLDEGSEVLCEPVDDPDRATGADAVAVRVGDVFVSVKTALANDLFERLLERGALPAFRGYERVRREPPLPDHGRTDFLLATPDGGRAYVEVKSCTHVEDGVAKFPDSPTERGRRHLRSLRSLVADGVESHLAFVVQRPDAGGVRPFREVDPDFADLLARAVDAGVSVHAVAVEFDPPHYRLRDGDLSVELV
ncbi:MAG: DNA/RNA nuclease SfsA [Haloferacaceae archaeon]